MQRITLLQFPGIRHGPDRSLCKVKIPDQQLSCLLRPEQPFCILIPAVHQLRECQLQKILHQRHTGRERGEQIREVMSGGSCRGFNDKRLIRERSVLSSFPNQIRMHHAVSKAHGLAGFLHQPAAFLIESRLLFRKLCIVSHTLPVRRRCILLAAKQNHPEFSVHIGYVHAEYNIQCRRCPPKTSL